MRRIAIVVVAVAGVWACGEAAGDAQSAADTLTRRQKDSIISEMPLPGAGGVGRALEAADRARERAERLEDIR